MARLTTRRALTAAAIGASAWLVAASARGDDELPRPALADACQACHGSAGISASDEIPNLAGQKRSYLAAQLAAFRSGERKNPLMAAIAAQLSDADIAELTAYWSRRSPPPTAPAHGASAPTAAVAAVASRMTFPAHFPQGFTLYETVPAEAGGPVVRRWANDAALQAARTGRALPAGAVIVVVNHAAGADAGAAAAAGKVLSYAAMEARAGWGDAVPALLRNGDWDYALFDGEGKRRDGLNEAPCLACHKPMAADSYVFTMKALRAAR